MILIFSLITFFASNVTYADAVDPFDTFDCHGDDVKHCSYDGWESKEYYDCGCWHIDTQTQIEKNGYKYGSGTFHVTKAKFKGKSGIVPTAKR